MLLYICVSACMGTFLVYAYELLCLGIDVNAHQTGGQVNGWRVAFQVSYIYESSISKNPKNNSCLCRLLCLGIESIINPKFIAVSMFEYPGGIVLPISTYLPTYLIIPRESNIPLNFYSVWIRPDVVDFFNSISLMCKVLIVERKIIQYII